MSKASDPSDNPIGHLYAMACRFLERQGENFDRATRLVDIAAWQKAAIIHERDRALRAREHTEEWYAERIKQIETFAKSKGFWPEVAAIIANGSVEPFDPPNYAQLLSRAKHRAIEAERRAMDAEHKLARMSAKFAAHPGGSDAEP